MGANVVVHCVCMFQWGVGVTCSLCVYVYDWERLFLLNVRVSFSGEWE